MVVAPHVVPATAAGYLLGGGGKSGYAMGPKAPKRQALNQLAMEAVRAQWSRVVDRHQPQARAYLCGEC